MNVYYIFRTMIRMVNRFGKYLADDDIDLLLKTTRLLKRHRKVWKNKKNRKID